LSFPCCEATQSITVRLCHNLCALIYRYLLSFYFSRMGECTLFLTNISNIRSHTLFTQVSSRDFLLGYAILQAFPGPNFNFAVYLGTLAVPTSPVLGAFLGFIGIFSPGIVLKLALLPLYRTWRTHEVAK